MNILLDSCDFLWFASGNPNLSENYQLAFSSPENVLFLSVVSDWEITIKCAIGKLSLPKKPSLYLPEIRQSLGIVSLPLIDGPALTVDALPWVHKDPFDRVIISQALFHGLTLASSDPLVRCYPVTLL